jgi:hypothetical protein
MGTPAAHYHQVRTAHFRRHAENARSPETREMYLRLAEREAAMAEAASGNQTSVVATAQPTNRDTDRAPGVEGSVRIDKPGRQIVRRPAPPHRNPSG